MQRALPAGQDAELPGPGLVRPGRPQSGPSRRQRLASPVGDKPHVAEEPFCKRITKVVLNWLFDGPCGQTSARIRCEASLSLGRASIDGSTSSNIRLTSQAGECRPVGAAANPRSNTAGCRSRAAVAVHDLSDCVRPNRR